MEVHKGIVRKHLGARALTKKVLRAGYFRMTWFRMQEIRKKMQPMLMTLGCCQFSINRVACYDITMDVLTIGVGHPRSIHLYARTIQVFDHSTILFYQVDLNKGSGEYYNSQHPE